MNRKIVIRNINLTNYPALEDYLSKMAKKGWMLKKIILSTIFIFKKTESKSLEFSITPYEIETFLNKKTKSDLNEFKEVVESAGWKHLTRSYQYYIYYKKSDEELIDIHTDKEEEFESIKKIAKRELIGYFLIIALFVIMLWSVLSDIDLLGFLISNTPLIIISMSIFIIPLSIIQIVTYKKFLYKNKKNIELGNDLEFNYSNIQSKVIPYLMIFSGIFTGLFFIDEIYKTVKYDDINRLYSFIPATIGLSFGTIFRYTFKKKKIEQGKKVMYFIILIIAAGMVTAIISINIEDEFTDEFIEKNSSIFIPDNYYNGWYTSNKATGYYNAANENIAKVVVDAIIDRRKSHIEEYKDAIGSMEYEVSFITVLSTKEYTKLKRAKGTENEDNVLKEIIDKNIIKGKNEVWNSDEIYYLSSDKTIAVVRWEDEVYYLKGYNFKDDENIKKVKEKLKLNKR